MRSPLQPLPALSREWGVELYTKRDDLLTFPLAGNKFRKLIRHLAEAGAETGDTLISVGGARSNHCRTVAMLAAERGMTARLVLHSDDVDADQGSSSVAMLRALGADLTFVHAEDIAREVEQLRAESSQSGVQVHVIPGGCHSPAGVSAYADAVAELAEQLPAAPNFIVCASGTGATQAGIVAGCAARGWSTRTIGISVARPSERGTSAVREALAWVSNHEVNIEFRDEWTGGGYEKSTASTAAAVALGWSVGLPLDPTYTGKAFDGLCALIGKGEIPRGSRVVFWHTGGLANFLDASK